MPSNVELVTHSTTQAVNALLEGDVATVGMIGMGRAPDLRKARKRTIETSHRTERRSSARAPFPSSSMSPTDSIRDTARDAVAASARTEARKRLPSPKRSRPTTSPTKAPLPTAAEQLGLPVTTSAELSGLYGLELRAVTAALNASILPIAIANRRSRRRRCGRRWRATAR